MTQDEILQEFEKGFDCCQIIFHEYAKQFHVEEELAYKISTGFGAGVFQGETCGAVIGAYMALGLVYGQYKTGEEGQEQKVISIIKNAQFREKFIEKYPSTMCNQLLNADFSTIEGKKKIQEDNSMMTFCPKLMEDVFQILEEIIE
ncbi:MAG: C-GCAxxG-C-C family protein [Lachnospiraceae bacterium]